MSKTYCRKVKYILIAIEFYLCFLSFFSFMHKEMEKENNCEIAGTPGVSF